MTHKHPYLQGSKIEAVMQMRELGHRAADVSAWIPVSKHSTYKRVNAYSAKAAEWQAQLSQPEELRRL